MIKLVERITGEDVADVVIKTLLIPVLLQHFMGVGATIAYFFAMAVLYAVVLKKDTLSTYVLIAGAGIIIGTAIVGVAIVAFGAITAALL